jgi:manganese/zinc/iron transport system permease protein
MTAGQLEIQAIAVVTSVACALVGTFLVLRRTALLSDAIGHSVLVGIAVAFLFTGSVTSPLLLVGAALTGLVTVALVDVVTRTGLVREDAAIGLVFPALFSIGVIVVSRYADGVHLDTDAVLLGELAFAPFDRLVIGGWDVGPMSLVLMSAVLVVDVLVVGAFNAVGSILVVALMIAPPATAYLLTDSLVRMTVLACAIGGIAALGGYWLSYALDASIAGCIAAVCGGVFGLAWLLAPGRGLVAAARRRTRQRLEFAQTMLAIHLVNHEGRPEEAVESRVDHLGEHLRWDAGFAGRVVRSAERRGLVSRIDGRLSVTERGRELAGRAVTH